MIDGLPRVTLGHWPTPLQPLNRLQAEIGGPLVWLKRDDCTGLATGGNKTRKLEFLLGTALDRGASTVVTFGALQSNHCRQTAAACAALGISCHLLLSTVVDRHDDHYLRSGNRLLDDLLGATIHLPADGSALTQTLADIEAASAGPIHLIEPGGSNAVGARGYLAAAAELRIQLEAVGADPDRVITATSTGGTAAGLAIGLADAGLATEAICVLNSASTTRPVIEQLIRETVDALNDDPERNNSRLAVEACAGLSVTDHELGPGYGIVTPATEAAVRLVARTEGVLLDPVYSGKAFADVVRRIRSRELTRDVVFVHTGGAVGLFAYAETFATQIPR